MVVLHKSCMGGEGPPLFAAMCVLRCNLLSLLSGRSVKRIFYALTDRKVSSRVVPLVRPLRSTSHGLHIPTGVLHVMNEAPFPPCVYTPPIIYPLAPRLLFHVKPSK
jgi:hypothetical protein